MAMDLGNSTTSTNSENKTAAVSFRNPKFSDSPSADTARYFEAMDWLMQAEPHGFSRPTIVGELVSGVNEARENDNPEDFLQTAAVLLADSTELEDLRDVLDETIEAQDE